MKGKTKAVGGNPTGAGAKQFTDFLTQGLKSGSFGGMGRDSNGMAMPFSQNAMGQTMGMGGAIDQLLSGNVGDPMTLTNFFRNGNGMAGFGDIANNFQAPSFQNAQFNQAPQFNSQYAAPQFQGTNLQGPQQISAPNFQDAFNQVNQANPFGMDNLRSVMNDELQQQVLSQNASLLGGGTGFMSSGKALGEAALRRDAAPRLGLALNQIGDTKANQALQLAGLSQQGQAFNQQAGMGFNDQMLAASNMQNQFGLQNAGQQAQFAQGAAGLNMDFMNQLNQLLGQQSGQQNQFNQGNAQFGATQDMNAQMQNVQNQLQNQQLGNNMQLGLGQLFQGFQGNQLNAQQNMLGQLFNAFNQLNALGTPQAQIVQQKSPFEQITGGFANIMGMFRPGGQADLSGKFGGAPAAGGTFSGTGSQPWGNPAE